MATAHRAEMKMWRKDLGEEAKERIKLGKKLEIHINESVDAAKPYTHSKPTFIPAVFQSEQICKICEEKSSRLSDHLLCPIKTLVLIQLHRTPNPSPP